MQAAPALEVKRVQHSTDLLNPGEYAFVAKREPIREITRTPTDPPRGFIKFIWWSLFGKKYIEKETILPLWPEYDTVILNCPSCNMPLATTPKHNIVSLDPLTIETPIACEYERTHGIATAAREEGKLVAFLVKDGKIMPAYLK